MDSKVHVLKCWPPQFSAIVARKKTAEFRLNDRDFKESDILVLLEWDPTNQKYTGAEELVRVSDIFYGPALGVPAGYCNMSIEICNGASLIVHERVRQVTKKWSPEHDDQHVQEELADAACYYAMSERAEEESKKMGTSAATPGPDNLYPENWHPNYAKRGSQSRVRQLVIAGALIAAEIDRLLRAAGSTTAQVPFD